MTQADRVLAALTRVGKRGLTRVDFQLPDVIDGGDPILNIPARIEELRKAGFEIGDDGRRHRCKVYVLSSAVGNPAPGLEAAAPDPTVDENNGQLFDVYVERDTSHWKAA